MYLDGFNIFTNFQPKMSKIAQKNMILGSNLAKNNRFCAFLDQNQSFWDLTNKLLGLIFYNCTKSWQIVSFI